MNPDLIALFRELAGRPLPDREAYYEAHQTPAGLRADVELLLQFDDQNAVDSFAGHVASAAIKALFPMPEGDSGGALPPPVAASLPLAVTDATFIGRYQVSRLLGRGGMAEVYLARDPVLERDVAVKLIAGQMDDDTGRRRLIREARAAGRLQHPNIVTIFDAGEHDGRPYIAMEYVAGETLRSLIQRRAPLPLRERLALIEGACAGLAHAHRAGVVHLDIKPDNLMRDDAGVVKVLDFGIARVLKGESFATRHILGTLRYMSPEQIAGDILDRRSDIFSLGCSLFELLSYVPAYSGSTKEIVYRIASGPVPNLADAMPGIDPRVSALVARAMALEADDRFQDLEELRAEVTRLRADIAGDEIPATHPVLLAAGTDASDRTSASDLTGRRGTRGQSLTRLWRSPATASIAAGLLLAGGAASLIWGARPVADPATTAAPTATSAAPVVDDAAVLRGDSAAAVPLREGEVWQLLARGERRAVLDLLGSGGGTAPVAFEVLDVVRGDTVKRRDSAGASAGAAAAPPFREADGHLARAERLREARQPVPAIAALWQAADLYLQALATSSPAVPAQTADDAGPPGAPVTTPSVTVVLPPPSETIVAPPRASGSAPASTTAAAAPSATSSGSSEASSGARPAATDTRAAALPAPPGDRDQILDVLNRYHAAYRALNVAAVLQVYPSLSGKPLEDLRSTFAGTRQYEVEMRDVRLQVDGAVATAEARVARRISPAVGNPLDFEVLNRFDLRRDGNRWVIVAVSGR